MNQSIHQILFHRLFELIHHPEVDIRHLPLTSGKQIPRMGVGVEKAMFEKLLQPAGDPHFDDSIGIDTHLIPIEVPRQLVPFDPFEG